VINVLRNDRLAGIISLADIADDESSGETLEEIQTALTPHRRGLVKKIP
jgi:hypothetical protein